MAKDLNNVVEINDGKFDKVDELLKEGKTILAAMELGPFASESLKKGFSDHFNAKIELKEMKENAGVCGCGKTANALVYLWRE